MIHYTKTALSMGKPSLILCKGNLSGGHYYAVAIKWLDKETGLWYHMVWRLPDSHYSYLCRSLDTKPASSLMRHTIRRMFNGAL